METLSVKRKCLVCNKEFTRKETKKRLKENRAIFCSRACFNTRRKLRTQDCLFCGFIIDKPPCKKRIFCSTNCSSQFRRKNGFKDTQVLGEKIRRMPEYNLWRKSVLKKNNGRCIRCGHPASHAHHIYDYCFIAREFKLKSLADAQNCRLLFDIRNGAPLCKKCHQVWHKTTQHSSFWLNIKDIDYTTIRKFRAQSFYAWARIGSLFEPFIDYEEMYLINYDS